MAGRGGKNTGKIKRIGRLIVATKIYVTKENTAIETNAKDERDYLEEVTSLVSQMIGDDDIPSAEALYLLPIVIPLIVDTCCKMRGYKANVEEKRTIIAGNILPGDIPTIYFMDPTSETILFYAGSGYRRGTMASFFSIEHKEDCPNKDTGIEELDCHGTCPSCGAQVIYKKKEDRL